MLGAFKSSMVTCLLLHDVATLFKTKSTRSVLIVVGFPLLIEEISIIFHASIDFRLGSGFVFNWLCKLLLSLDLSKLIFYKFLFL